MCESEEGGLVPFEASSPISIHLFLILSPDDNEGGDDEAAKTLRLRRRRRGRASGESPCCHRRRAGRDQAGGRALGLRERARLLARQRRQRPERKGGESATSFSCSLFRSAAAVRCSI